MSKFFNKYIFILLGFIIFWIGIIPLFFSRMLPIICENITYNSEYKIEIQKPKLILNIIPTATIKSDSLKIIKKDTKEFIFADNPELKIRLFPLIAGTVHVNKLFASNIEFYLNLPENPHLEKDFFQKLEKTKFKFDALELNRFTIVMNKEKEPITIEGNGIKYRKNSRYVKFFADSKIKLKEEQSKIFVNLFLPRNNDIKSSDLSIKINNFDIKPICDFFKHYLPNDIKDVYGKISIDINKNNLDISFINTAIVKKDDSNSMYFPQDLSIKSDFNLTQKTILINNADIKSKNINTSFSGTITNYLGKVIPTIDLNIRINPSKVEEFIALMPPIQTEDIDGYKLKKYKFYGDVIGNINVKGNSKEPSVNGNLYITNGILTKPIPNAKGATIKLKFLGKYLNFDVLVPTNRVEKVFVKGGVELYNVKYSDMHIWSTKSVDLATAEEKMVPIHEILKFIIGPVPIMDIRGIGNIDITVKGNRKDPHIWGIFNLMNVKTFFLEMPDLVLTDSEAAITFDDESAVFKISKGLINNKPINISGTCNVSGKFDFDAKLNGQEISYLYNALTTSTLVDDIKSMLPKLDIVSGLADMNLKVYGSIKDFSYVKYRENFFTKGEVKFLGNNFGVEGIKITDTKGSASFDDTNISFDLISKIGRSSFDIKGSVKDNIADITAKISRLNINDILVKKDNCANILVNVDAKYKGKTNEPEYDKLDFNAKIIGSEPNNKLKISTGEILLKRGKLSVKNLNGNFENTSSSFNLDFIIDRITSNPNVSGKIYLKNFELSIFNMFSNNILLPKNITDITKKIRFDKGKINLKADLWNNNVNASTDIGGISFTYLPLNLPVKIINGSLYLKRNYLGLNKINMLADGMPILVDGGVSNLFSKNNFDIYINSKPQQYFIDKYFNNSHVYPLKIKGDIVYQIKAKGTKDDFELSSNVNMARDSSIYYLGATVGDLENAIFLDLDMNVVKQNLFKIKEFSYDKLISSQSSRQTRLNMLKAFGSFETVQNDLVFNNLHIKTQNPTDAKIFNIIFRKPNIKQGQFTSDLKINGKLSNPSILGSFHIFETDIPFLDTSLKNITLLFKDKFIDISTSGEILGNDIKFKGKLHNNINPPFYIEDAELYTKIIDLNYITEKIKESQVNETDNLEPFKSLNLKDFVVKNIKMSANSIRLRNIAAENIEASASLNKNQVLNINKFKFNMANGFLDGNFEYNFKNHNTSIKLSANNIDANTITYAVFDLNNQLFGELTGNMELSCNGSNFNKCMETLNGNTNFNVSNGRMPKLGSLEYLLKAGNVIKGGLTSLSINGFIDIISPMKTGNFDNIYGVIAMKNGVAENIEIATKGKDLSLFITGTYNFATSNADMEVLGMLSKKISTLLGPIGNVSINSLFNIIPWVDLSKDTALRDKINKIPGIELSNKAYRKFVAEIQGNINEEGFVQTFKWIN